MSLLTTIQRNASGDESPAAGKGAKVARIGGAEVSRGALRGLVDRLPAFGVRQSFTVVGGLFLLPVSLLLFYFVSELNASINFSAKEKPPQKIQ